jgi:hypothetical protein
VSDDPFLGFRLNEPNLVDSGNERGLGSMIRGAPRMSDLIAATPVVLL